MRFWRGTGLFLLAFQNSHEGEDSVPVACGRWLTEQLVDPAKIADGLHLPTVHAKDKLVLRRDYSHEPLPIGRNVTGRAARRPPAFDKMLTNRTMSGRGGSVPKGLSFARRRRSRPSQNTTSASNGSFRNNAARNFSLDP